MKICSKCKNEKDVSKFRARPTAFAKDGLNSQCKQCKQCEQCEKSIGKTKRAEYNKEYKQRPEVQKQIIRY